jgi:hypothetical protein
MLKGGCVKEKKSSEVTARMVADRIVQQILWDLLYDKKFGLRMQSDAIFFLACAREEDRFVLWVSNSNSVLTG